jgi:hypothetical protein
LRTYTTFLAFFAAPQYRSLIFAMKARKVV